MPEKEAESGLIFPATRAEVQAGSLKRLGSRLPSSSTNISTARADEEVKGVPPAVQMHVLE